MVDDGTAKLPRVAKCSDPPGLRPDFEVPYDYPVVACVTRHSYFGHPEWERLAVGAATLIAAPGLFIRQRDRR